MQRAPARLALRAALLGASLCAWVPSQARAQAAPRALPALWETPSFAAPAQPGRLAGALRYGYTEPLAPLTNDTHHRLGAGLAAAYTLDLGDVALGAELNLVGRLDFHKSDQRGSDSSAIGEPRILVRYSHTLPGPWSAGLEVGLWVPGEEAPSLAWGATTLDALAGVTRAASRGTASLALGYRLDRSAETLRLSPDRTVSETDWVSLGISAFDALLVRAGYRHDLEPLSLFAEWRSDLLLGDGAPGLGKSPHLISLGAARALGDRLSLGAVVHVLVSQRSIIDVNGDPTPYPARVGVSVALSLDLGGEAEPPASTQAAPPAAPPPSAVRVRVTSQGRALPGAIVELAGLQVTADDQGKATISDAPPGEHTLQVSAEGYLPRSEPLTVRAGASSSLDIELTPRVPEGALRVLVRDARSGRALDAALKITLDDGQVVEARTQGDAGVELQLPPGQHTVTLQARGYRRQQRRVTVDDGGVTLLNAALDRARR